MRLGREMNSLKVTFPTFDSFPQSVCFFFFKKSFFYCDKIHITKFTMLTILSVQFSVLSTFII